MDSALIELTPPVAEPVALGELIRQCGLTVYEDEELATQQSEQFSGLLQAAREDCENYCRTPFITRTYLYQMDHFPTRSFDYDSSGFSEIRLPAPPFQSIDLFQYVDTTGELQDLPRAMA